MEKIVHKTKRRTLMVFPALVYKDYRLYFIAQVVAISGRWLMMVVMGWLVYDLTSSAFMVGLSTALVSIPTLLFGLFGGVLVDRISSKKNILYATQGLIMIFIFLLGLLTILGVINVVIINVLVFLVGVVLALDNPTRQVFVAEMVDRTHLPSAVALNTALINFARIIGPAFAGFLIFFFGAGWAFMVASFCYAFAVGVIYFISNKKLPIEEKQHPIKAVVMGISYAWSNKPIRVLLLFLASTSILGWSYTSMLPVIAKANFDLGATGLGYMYSAFGVGALMGTILVSAYANRINKIKAIFFGNMLFCVFLILFSLSSNFLMSLVFLAVAGCGIITQLSMTNATIQLLIENKIRGRVMSIFIFMFFGMMPMGSLEIGALAEKIGALPATTINASILLILAIYVYVFKDKLMGKVSA